MKFFNYICVLKIYSIMFEECLGELYYIFLIFFVVFYVIFGFFFIVGNFVVFFVIY